MLDPAVVFAFVSLPITVGISIAVHSGTHPCREDCTSLHGHDIATLAVTAVFAARADAPAATRT